MKKALSKIAAYAANHKALSAIAIVALAGASYYAYRAATSAPTVPSYTVTRASIGTISQTVTGTGQVSAENQLDLASKVSGQITSISVKVGQHVEAGDLIATIDYTDAARSLESARIALAKLTEAAKPGDLTNAQNNLQKSYSDGFNSVTGAFADLQTVLPSLKDLLYSQTGFLSDQRASYLTATAQNYRMTAATHYDTVSTRYLTVLAEYKSLNRNSGATSTAALLEDTRGLVSDVAGALKDAQNAITFISNTQPDYQQKDLASAQASVNSWSSLMTSDVSSILSSQNAIASNSNALNNLITGADALDIQSQQLSLQQAQETYDDYFIRAPFAGTIGRIPVSVYSQASNGTVIATIIGDAKVSTVSLNEVDAAKVKAGQPAAITFDAIDGFTATGTVQSIDLVGAVSQGVVSYNAKISISTPDPRILPGMSLNVTITTFEKAGVLIVPSAAIKTSGKQSTVQILDQSVVSAYMQGLRAQNGMATSSNGPSFNGFNGSSTRTGNFSGGNFARNGGRQISLTIPSASTPASVTVETGSSDGSNTEIVSGLQGGEWIVVRTVSSTATASAAATTPSILSSLSGNRGGAGIGGAVRIGGGGFGGGRGN